MPKKRPGSWQIPEVNYKCTYCGAGHAPAQIQRVDFDNLKCRVCGKTFAAKAEPQ